MGMDGARGDRSGVKEAGFHLNQLPLNVLAYCSSGSFLPLFNLKQGLMGQITKESHELHTGSADDTFSFSSCFNFVQLFMCLSLKNRCLFDMWHIFF